MKAEEIRGMSDDELSSKLVELKREQLNLRFQKATGQLENTARQKQVRRDVARLLTASKARSAK